MTSPTPPKPAEDTTTSDPTKAGTSIDSTTASSTSSLDSTMDSTSDEDGGTDETNRGGTKSSINNVR